MQLMICFYKHTMIAYAGCGRLTQWKPGMWVVGISRLNRRTIGLSRVLLRAGMYANTLSPSMYVSAVSWLFTPV